MGVLGIASLQYSSYLVVATSRQVVGHMPHGLVYRVTSPDMRVLGPASKGVSKPLELSHRAMEVKLLEELLDTYPMFYSHDFDFTQTQQRLAQRGMLPIPMPAPPSVSPPPSPSSPPLPRYATKIAYSDRASEFVWNTHLLASLAELPGPLSLSLSLSRLLSCQVLSFLAFLTASCHMLHMHTVI